VFHNLPHAFFHFAGIVPDANAGVKLAGQWLREACENPTADSEYY
jgi:hypothetical protein